MENILIVLGGIAAGGLILWFFWRLYMARQARKMGFREASEHVRKIYPVWAGLGPFENGDKSARAMKAAYAAILGPEEAAKAEETFEKHRIAYNQEPEAWENLRKDSLKASSEINDYITIAKGLIAMERLNEGLFGEVGRRVEAVTNEKGEIMDFALKQIWSDEEVKKHEEETSKALINILGEGLLNKETDAANGLLYFIVWSYRVGHEKDPETAYEIGKILSNFIIYSDKNPEEEISKEFRLLYDAYLSDNDEDEQNT